MAPRSIRVSSAEKSSPGEDELAIRKVLELYQNSWNSHDMTAFESIFPEDAIFVNVRGMFWRGCKEIKEKHMERHRMQFKKSKAEIGQVEVRLLRSGIALVHGEMRIEGDMNPNGTPRPVPRDTVFTAVARKEPAGWRIIAFQNTNRTEWGRNGVTEYS